MKNSLNILLIEDNPGDIRLIKELLHETQNNIYLFSATNLGEGINILLKEIIDVLFLDLSLPESQGLQTLKKIRLKINPHIPIVVLTGLDDNQIALLALKEGAQDYLIKGKISGELIVRTAYYSIERHKMNMELKKKTRELIQSNEELEQFTYIVSHDLQAPLNTLIGFGDLLSTKLKNIDHKSLNYLRRMKNAALRMKSLIEDLLELALITTKEKNFDLVDLNEIIKQVLSDLEDLISKTKGKVTLHKLLKIRGDPQQLRQLFQNLIENGLKFSKKSKPPHIIIAGKKTKNFFEVQIKDNGIGFDETYLNEIFKPFKRIHQQSLFKGNGLGLATCKKIMERHEGSIKAKSILKQGSTFIVKFSA